MLSFKNKKNDAKHHKKILKKWSIKLSQRPPRRGTGEQECI